MILAPEPESYDYVGPFLHRPSFDPSPQREAFLCPLYCDLVLYQRLVPRSAARLVLFIEGSISEDHRLKQNRRTVHHEAVIDAEKNSADQYFCVPDFKRLPRYLTLLRFLEEIGPIKNTLCRGDVVLVVQSVVDGS